MSSGDKDNCVLGISMAPYILKAGLNRFCIKWEEAVPDELSQIHDMKNFFPMEPKTITREEQTKEIASLVFLK